MQMQCQAISLLLKQNNKMSDHRKKLLANNMVNYCTLVCNHFEEKCKNSIL